MKYRKKKSDFLWLAALLLVISLTACTGMAEKVVEMMGVEKPAGEEAAKKSDGKTGNSEEAGAFESKVKVFGNEGKTEGMSEGDTTKDVTERLSSEEAKKILMKDYEKYVDYLAVKVPEFEPMPLTSEEDLYEVPTEEEKALLKDSYFVGSGFNQMRERYPGKYAWFLLFRDETQKKEYFDRTGASSIDMFCLYVNLDTGMTFIDSSIIGIYRLPDLYNVAYQPYALDGAAELDFLLWVLQDRGIISSMYKYTDSWSLTIESEEPMGDAMIALGAEWDSEVELIELGEYITRLPVYHMETYEKAGIYDFNVKERVITDYYTGEEIYRDPMVATEPKSITNANAKQELIAIFEKLCILSEGEAKNYSFSVQPFTAEEHEWINEGFEIKVTSASAKASEEVLGTFYMSMDGTKVSKWNPIQEQKEAFYGTALILW